MGSPSSSPGIPLLPGSNSRASAIPWPGRIVGLSVLCLACLLFIGARDSIGYIFDSEGSAPEPSASPVLPLSDARLTNAGLSSAEGLANSTRPIVEVSAVPAPPQRSEGGCTKQVESFAAVERANVESANETRNSLTRSLLERIAENETVVLTVGNSGRREFLENLVQSLRRSGCTSLVIGATDDDLLAWLQENDVPAFMVDLGRDDKDSDGHTNLEWRGRTYLKLMKAKVSNILAVMRLGFSVIWTDSDVVWLRNPIPFVVKYPDYDFLASSDQMYGTERSEKLESAPTYSYLPNTGIALYRPTAEPLVLAWLDCISKGKESDQPCLQHLIRQDLKGIPNEEKDAALGFFDSTVMGTLPINYFVGGQMWLERYPEQMGVMSPYARHSTWQRCPEAKIHRLREDGLWLLDGPDWYSHPVGFISYDHDIDPELIEAVTVAANLSTIEMKRQSDLFGQWPNVTVEDRLPHLNLMNYQLRQLRSQLVLAAELGGAAAIVPEFMCGMGKDTYALDGRVAGSHTELPFRCPADMVLDFRTIHRDNPNGFREYSFLRREEARALNATRLDITICTDDEPNCEEGDQPFSFEHSRTMNLKPLRTLAQLRTLFAEPLQEHKLIHFHGNMSQLMAMTPAEVKKHSNATQKYMMGTCCVHEYPHVIRYDMFWDIPGHYTAAQTFIDGTWMPKPELYDQCN